MAEIIDEVDRASDVIDKERKDLTGFLKKDVDPEIVNGALGRIERTLYTMSVRIKEGKFDLSKGNEHRIEDLVKDVDHFRQLIINQISSIEEKGMDQDPDEIMDEVKDGYKSIIDKYVQR